MKRFALGGLLMAGLLLAPAASAADTPDRLAILKAQDLATAPLNEEKLSQKEQDGVITTEFYLNGGEFNGAPSRIYGFYSRPAKEGKYPGVVQLHGAGLSVLKPDSSIYYAKNGYCCISIDWCGPAKARKTPRTPPFSEFESQGNMAFPSPKGSKNQFTAVELEKDGIVNGEHFVQRAFMYLRERPEVRKDALFLSGMSAGAHLSLVTLGVVPDIRGATVKYGEGFIRDLPGYFGGYFGPLSLCSKEEQDRWLAVLDPKHGIKDYKASVLLLSGTDDIFFAMPIVLKTYREIPTEKRLLMLPNDNHTQVGNEVIPLRYFRSLLKEAPAFPDAEAPVAQLNGSEVALSCKFTAPSKVTKTEFIVKRMPQKTFYHGARKGDKTKWESIAAKVENGVATATVPAPAEGEQIVAYLLIEDETAAKVSSDTVEFPVWPKWRGEK